MNKIEVLFTLERRVLALEPAAEAAEHAYPLDIIVKVPDEKSVLLLL